VSKTTPSREEWALDGESDAPHGYLRRALKACLHTRIGYYTFRATGIAGYLEARRSLENAQAMTAHGRAKEPQRVKAKRAEG